MNLSFTRDQARFCFAVMDAAISAVFTAAAAIAASEALGHMDAACIVSMGTVAAVAAPFALIFAGAALAAIRGRNLHLIASEPIGRARRRETYIHCVGPLCFTAHFDGFPHEH